MSTFDKETVTGMIEYIRQSDELISELQGKLQKLASKFDDMEQKQASEAAHVDVDRIRVEELVGNLVEAGMLKRAQAAQTVNEFMDPVAMIRFFNKVASSRVSAEMLAPSLGAPDMNTGIPLNGSERESDRVYDEFISRINQKL